MENIWKSLIPFLAILNPFALCLYLVGVMEDLDKEAFLRVLIRACGISFAVFCVFGLAGEPFLVDLLGIRPDALRIFGGVIFFIVGYNYVVKGYRTNEMLRGSLDELPSAIALPFMIGAGTLTQSILIGKQHSMSVTILVISIGILVSFAIVLVFKLIRDHMRGPKERVFERYVNIMVRINGLLIGAISTEMIISGVRNMWST